MRYYIEKEGLTERHARALLKVDDPEVMWTVLRAVTDRHLNVEQTESMIAHLLGEDAPADKHRRKVVPLFRDVRIFVNTVNKAIATMQASGIDAVSNKNRDRRLYRIPCAHTQAYRRKHYTILCKCRQTRLKRETVLTYSPLFITRDGSAATPGHSVFHVKRSVGSQFICFM